MADELVAGSRSSQFVVDTDSTDFSFIMVLGMELQVAWQHTPSHEIPPDILEVGGVSTFYVVARFKIGEAKLGASMLQGILANQFGVSRGHAWGGQA
jgi:hypothetical protein